MAAHRCRGKIARRRIKETSRKADYRCRNAARCELMSALLRVVQLRTHRVSLVSENIVYSKYAQGGSERDPAPWEVGGRPVSGDQFIHCEKTSPAAGTFTLASCVSESMADTGRTRRNADCQLVTDSTLTLPRCLAALTA